MELRMLPWAKLPLINRRSCLTLYLLQLIWKERFGGHKKTTVHNIEIRAGIRRRDVQRYRRGSTYYFSFLNLTFIFIDWCGHSVSWLSCSSKTISLWSNPSLSIWWRNCRRRTGAAATAGFQLSARATKSLKQIFIRSVNILPLIAKLNIPSTIRECVRNLILRVHTAAIAVAAAGARAWARRDDRHRRVLSFIRPVRPRSYLDFPKKSIFLSDLLTYLSSSEWGKLGTSI